MFYDLLTQGHTSTFSIIGTLGLVALVTWLVREA